MWCALAFLSGLAIGLGMWSSGWRLETLGYAQLAGLLNVVAWPAVVLLSLLLFQKEIRLKLREMSRYKSAFGEAEFDREMTDVGKVEEVPLPTEAEIVPGPVVLDPGEHAVYDMADKAPRMAVLYAWRIVRAELDAYAMPLNAAHHLHWTDRIATILVHERGLSGADAALIERMRLICDGVDSALGWQPSSEQATRYARTAVALASRIRNALGTKSSDDG